MQCSDVYYNYVSRGRPLLQDEADISVVLFLGGKGGGLGFASIVDIFASDDWEVDEPATAGSDCTRVTSSASSSCEMCFGYPSMKFALPRHHN